MGTVMGKVGPYELVERVDGPLWRVRGPDRVAYTLVNRTETGEGETSAAEHSAGAAAGSRLRHRRIPGMTALVDHGPGYLVYEDLPGVDLATEVRLHGPLRGERLTELLAVTARVLADLHRAGADHGGLVPSRVFLDGERVVVAGPCAGGGADLVAWADLARFAATGDGAIPLTATLADLLIDCTCLPADRRPPATEVCRRIELLTPPHRGDGWAELARLIGMAHRRWPAVRRVPRPLARAYDEMHGTAPLLELLYQFAAHDEREGTDRARTRRGDRVAFEPSTAACGAAGATVIAVVEVTNRGRVHWHNRFLRRTGPKYGANVLDTPEFVALPDLRPGEVATVPVRVVLPGGPGVFGQRLTLVDEDGRCRTPRDESSVVVRVHVDPV